MKTIILAVIALSASSVFALNLKEQKQLKEWSENINKEYSAGVNKACGTTVAATIDPALVSPFMAANTSASAQCGDAMDAIRHLCSDDVGKTSIKKNIKKVECKNGKKGEVTFALASGTFTVNMGPDASNHQAKAKDYLENNLK